MGEETGRIPEALSRRLSVRFMKLRFTLQMLEDAHLPRYKNSALRGGMGQMLIAGNCILDRRCGKSREGYEGCPYEEECIVRRLMYARYRIQPPFATEGDSIGYSLFCPDYREEVPAGYELKFEMTLFGRLLVHLNPILQAISALGQAGLGGGHARFRILGIENSRREPILDGNNIYLSRYIPETLEDYVLRRLPHLTDDLTLRFRTPATLKHNGAFLEHFDPEVILNACARRLYMLDCFEGIDLPQVELEENPRLVSETAIHTVIPRYSSTQDSRIKLHGIRGEATLADVDTETKALLLAGEVMQIGKNVSMGFGKYVVA